MITNVKKFTLRFMTLIQIAVLIAVATLEYLSDKKMGVMRYLMYKSSYYEETVFNPDLTYVYKCILVILLLFSIVALLVSFVKIKKPKVTINLFSVMSLNLIIYIFISLKGTIDLKAYYFFVIAFLVVLLAEYLRLFLKSSAILCRAFVRKI